MARGKPPRADIDSAVIAGLYRSGSSMREIAASLGCSVNLIQGRLKAIGVPRRPARMPRSAVPFEVVRRRYLAGESVTAMARELGLHPVSIYNRLKRHGTPMARPDPRIGRRSGPND